MEGGHRLDRRSQEPGAAAIIVYGAVAERPIAPVLKTGGRKTRGFESLPLRWTVSGRLMNGPLPGC